MQLHFQPISKIGEKNIDIKELNMNSLKITLLSIIILLSFSYCNKNKDLTAPKINIISPKNQDTIIATNNEIKIQFIIIDNIGLESSTLSLYNDQSNKLINETKQISGTTFNYENSISISGTKNQLKRLNLKIECQDVNGNKSIQENSFYVVI